MLENKNQIEFFKYLSTKLKNDLLGTKAHKLMAPKIKGDYYRSFEPEKNTRSSAVLVLFVAKDNKLNLLFTLRSNNISHSGQISFPGGRSEINETAEQTALRETREEVGISKNIEIIGQLSTLFVPPSNFLIIPIVGYINYMPSVTVNSDEVQEAFVIPYEYFLSNKYLKREIWDFKGQNVEVPFWDIHSTPLWGATAMMLMELVELSKDFYL